MTEEAAASEALGHKLFGLVEHYAAMGHHRTGSEVDQSTAEWMRSELAARGLDAEVQPVPYDRWVAASSLTADGTEIGHLAVPYEWTGSIDTTEVAVVDFDAKRGGFADLLAEPIAQARADGAEAVVLATRHPEGALVGVNRDPEAGSGFPTVLAAGADLDRLQQCEVRLTMNASLEDGFTHNVVARTSGSGDASANAIPALLVTTPMTGWFSCAGERATGIAVLLEVVDRLAAAVERPLLVVATGAHELEYLAAKRWVDEYLSLDIESREPVAGVLHIGASVAVLDPASPEEPDAERQLAATRVALTNLASDAIADLAAPLEPARLNLIGDVEQFLGEGTTFSALGVPLVSFSGAGLDFHTPNDSAQRATSPKAMATVAEAFVELAKRFERLLSDTEASAM